MSSQGVSNELQMTRLTHDRMIWLRPHPLPLSRQLARRHTRRLRMRDNMLTGENGRGGGGAKSYDDEKAWSSIQ
jgi:hypothetical protein